ncbi:MAG: hypothetical protein ACR2NP_01915 [Pirellulaceae bacterium]
MNSEPDSKRQLTGRRQHLRRRLIAGVALLSFCMIVVWVITNMLQASLRNPAWTTGYLLMGCLLFLTAYNWRKKLSFIPRLGSSRAWMQAHIYVALASNVIFVSHIGFAFPNGSFEQLLATLYVIVAASGIYGLYITRTTPKRLTALNNEVIFEQIPILRRRLVQRARQLIRNSAESTDVLARFYVNHLVHFLERPRSLAWQLAPSQRRSRQLVLNIRALDRYLSDSGRESGRQLAQLVREKDDLDYHRALQGRLKIWLFVHIGLTYGLLITAVLHGLLAHSFGGGLR